MKFNIHIKPNSKKGPLVELQDDGSLKVHVKEIAVDGEANEALLKLLAKHLDVPKNCVAIIKGHKSRHKVIEVDIKCYVEVKETKK